MISQSVEQLGIQQPRLSSIPPFATSAGDDAIELAESVGIVLDPWQQLVLRGALGERLDQKWSAFEVGLVVPRQNGKGTVLEVRELAGLFLFGEQLILHSAHEFKTAADGFRRVLGAIESSPDLLSRVKRVYRSHGDEGIELHNGARLRFVARTGGSGRGFSADLVILDEAYNLPEHAMAALLPTMSARPNPQIWYTSSAVNAEEHPNGLVLSRLRRRGVAAGDPSLAYFEWSAPDAEFTDDKGDPLRYDELRSKTAGEGFWAQANPGLGIRIASEHIARERRTMGVKGFLVERLGVGDWIPEPTDDIEHVVDLDTWVDLVDRTASVIDPVAFAFDAKPDRSVASIAMVGHREDGRIHAEIVDSRKGVVWLTDRLVELQERWRPCAIILDPKGPAGSLLPALADAGVVVTAVTAGEYAQACGSFADAVAEKTLTHMGDVRLDSALEVATTRPLGDSVAWDKRADTPGDITPLVAVTLALFGLAKYDVGMPAIY